MRKLLITILVVLVACSGSLSTGPERVIDIILTEFSITPFTVNEGETVTFNIQNDGAILHEFRFTIPSNDHNHDADHALDGDVVTLAPDQSGSLTVTFDDMYTEAACLLPGHYEAGMFVTIREFGSEHG